MDVEYIGAGRYLAGVPATGLTAAEIAAGGWAVEELIASGCYRAAGQEPEPVVVLAAPDCNTVLQEPEQPAHPAPEPEEDGPPVPPLALLDVWEDAEEQPAPPRRKAHKEAHRAGGAGEE